MDSRICQTFAVSPAKPGDFPLLVKPTWAGGLMPTLVETLLIVQYIHATGLWPLVR